jgi:hypothetical protein
MTEPQDPKQGAPPEGEPHHGVLHDIGEQIHHGVEAVEEAVEEVVEHVPKPVRWTIGKIVRVVLLSAFAFVLVVAVSAVLWVMNRTEWVAQELTLLVNQTLALRSDVTVSVRDIRGNPFTGVRLIEARVHFRGDSGPALLEAPSVGVAYDAIGILTGRTDAIVIDLERPVIRLERGEGSRFRLPQWKSAGAGKGKPRGLDVRFRVRDGRVLLPAPQETVEHLDLEGRAALGVATQVDLMRLSWASGPYGSRLTALEATVSAGDSVRFTLRRLETDDLRLSGVGGWRKGESEKRMHLEVDRVRWSWLARVFQNPGFDVPGEGRFTVDATGNEDWQGAFRAAVVWDSLPMRGDGAFTWKDNGLVVQPLRLQSPAGELDGRYDYRKEAWAIGGRVRHGDPAHWGAIQLHGWPAGDLNGTFRYAMDKRGPTRAALTATLGPSVIADWRADSALFTLDQPPGGPDSFTVVMLRRGGEARLRAASQAGGWQGAWTAQNYPLDEWPDGRRTGLTGRLDLGAGTAAGQDGDLLVTGVLEGSDAEWLGTRMGRFRLDSLDGVLLPRTRLATRVDLGDVTFLGVHFDSARASLDLEAAAARFSGLRATAGDTVVTGDGDAQWSESGWKVALSDLRARSSQFDFVAEPPVRIAGDPQGTVLERMVARDGEARIDIVGRWAAAGGFYDWQGRASGLDPGRIGLPAEWGLGGRVDATLDVEGNSGDPRWSFRGVAVAPVAQGHHADSLRLELTGRPSVLELRRADLWVGGGRVSGEGEVTGTAAPWPDTLTADGVLRWLADAARWRVNARAEDAALEGFAVWNPRAGTMRGRLDATLALAGSPAHPEFDLTARAEPLVWNDYRVDALEARARYRGRTLEVPELRATRAGVASTIVGRMPLELALGARPVLPDEPMAFRADVDDGDLAVLPQFVPQIGHATGRFDLHATVEGTPRAPVLAGSGRVRGGAVRLAAREEVLENVEARFGLSRDRITLDTLTARQGRRGLVRGSGAVELDGLALKGYRFDLAMRDFTAVETGLYVASFDGDFAVTDGPRVHGHTVPQVTGAVELREGVVLYDFANVSETEALAATTQPLFWTYRIELNATDRLHWRPPNADIEFSAALTLEQTADSLIIYGDMGSLRGNYWFLSNRFDITKADLTFDNVSGVNPVLDVEASTRLTVAERGDLQLLTSSESRPESYEIVVRIQGRANEPQISFESIPGDLDQAQILSQLTIGRFRGEGNAVDFRDPLDNYVTQAINRQLSAELSQVFKGYVQEWSLERESGGLFGGSGGYVVGVRVPITPDLDVRYRQNVSGVGTTPSSALPGTNPFERDVAAEYRINRFFYITAELAERRAAVGSTTSASGTTDFNVNLKARWEY